ncbi:MAG TPA: putative glycoside hydrolase [Longimicrobiales bacterium]|nr:putative glycoside hydrolase [Longimicrobiales bacterium]
MRQFFADRRALYVGGAVLVLLVIGGVAFTRALPAPQPTVVAEPMAVPSAALLDSVAADTVPAGLGRPASILTGDAAFAFDAIGDGVPRVAKPDAVKGLYLNAWAAGSSRKLARLIDIADRTEINTFVIDVKEGGQISYRSRVPLAREIGADQNYISDVRRVLQQLRAHGIYPIARIVVFRDETLANARPDWAVRHVAGGDWVDADGHAWVDSFNRHVWDYNIAIAREALELGFSEIQWDYVRFPDVPQALMRTAAWPAQAGRSKADAIREFLLYSREQLKPYDAPVTADVFGLTVSARTDMGIGQLWEKMADATAVLLPMVYPSHFARGSYGIAQPNASPRETVLRAMQYAVRRNSAIDGAAAIRPWLQDFTLGQPRYTAAHVRAQIDAVYDAGLTEWVLWHAGSNYTVAALATSDGVVPKFPAASDTAALDTVRQDTVKVDTARVDTVRIDTAVIMLPKPDTLTSRP